MHALFLFAATLLFAAPATQAQDAPLLQPLTPGSAPQTAWSISSAGDRLPVAAPPASSGSPVAGQIVFGLLGGAFAMVVGGAIGAAIDSANCGHDDWFCGLGGAMVGGGIGLVLGSTAGVYAVGSNRQQTASFPVMIGASMLGLVAGAAVAGVIDAPGEVVMTLLIFTPTLGALVGFNATRRARVSAIGAPRRVPDPLTRGQSRAWQVSLLCVRW